MTLELERAVNQTKAFIKKAFKENPKYSFNNWSIMYDHSLKVHALAISISSSIASDQLVVQLGALLHDIGKTYDADEDTLRQKHGELAHIVSKEHIQNIGLSPAQLDNLTNILREQSGSPESKIIKDADTLAFLADPILQTALMKWADTKGLSDEIPRKIRKAELLNYDVSRELAKPLISETKTHWNL